MEKVHLLKMNISAIIIFIVCGWCSYVLLQLKACTDHIILK